MLWLFLLLVVAPAVELAVIVQVSGAIGVLDTIVALVLTAAIGSWLVKREGLRVWRRFNEQMAAGVVPERELADGVLILGAGALLVAPGFVSDVVALLLLLPPTRAVARTLLLRRRGRGPGRTRVVRATYGGRMDGSATGGSWGGTPGGIIEVTGTPDDTLSADTRPTPPGEIEP